MLPSPEPGSPTHTALEGVLDELRAECTADRCTLRLDLPDQTFPVVVESRGAGVGTLIGERTVTLPGQPVVEALRAGAGQVVQDDCLRAHDDPAFRAMLTAYGGLSAQIVTAVRNADGLRGIVSVHVLGGTRAWTSEHTGAAQRACVLIDRILG